MAVNKCNIIDIVNAKLTKLKSGIYCHDESALMDNYIYFTNCPTTVDRNSCYPDNCSNPVLFVPCIVSITAINKDVDLDEGTVRLYIDEGNILNSVLPIDYEWNWDESVFDLVSGKYSSEVILAIKGDKKFDSIVTQVGVTIHDGNGCPASKTCVITPAQMQCAPNYTLCPNTRGLKVKNKFVQCANPVGLRVRKK